MEISLEKSSGSCNTEIPKKKKCLDLQTIYKVKVLDEGPGTSNKSKYGKDNEGKVVDGIKKKRKSLKELSSGRLNHVEKKSRNSPEEVDGLQLRSGSGSVSTDMSGGLSAFCHKNGLNGAPFNFDGNGNVLHIPKRPRCPVDRRKFEGGRNGEVSGTSSTIHQVGSLHAQLRKAESSGSSGAEAGSEKRVVVELTAGSVGKVGSSKVKRKRANSDVKGSGNDVVSYAHNAREEHIQAVANNGDVSSKKRRSNFRKRKDMASVDAPSVLKVEPLLDNPGKQERGEEEENLEQNAARMLSSRFDQSCTSTSKSPSHNGGSFSVSSGPDFVSRSDPMAVVELDSADAANRILRPRKQRKEKGKPRKRRHFYEVITSHLDAHWFLNRRIKVFWPLDESWYYGLANDYDPETKLHHVKYDDREEEWISLQHEKFKILLLPSEVPGKRERRRASRSKKHVNKGKEHMSADDDSLAEAYLDSEPIISWLARSFQRVKSSPFNSLGTKKTLPISSFAVPSLIPVETVETEGYLDPSVKDGSKTGRASILLDRSTDGKRIKKSLWTKKTLPMSSFAGPSFVPVETVETGGYLDPSSEDRSKTGCASILLDRSTDGERITNSLMGSPSGTTMTDYIVYVRKRFRKNIPVNAREIKKVCSSELGNFVSPPNVDRWQPAEACKNIFWSIDDQGLIRLTIPAIDFNILRFRLCSLPFLERSFKAEESWLSRALLLQKHGAIVAACPDVVLEILFVDNAIGLRFLSFEGCLKHAIALFSLILTVFNQCQGDWLLYEQPMPMTSIRFKLSAKHDCWKQQVFTFYSFSMLRPSKWLYLDAELQRRCLLKRQLPLADCTYDNLKLLEGDSHQLHIAASLEAGPSQFKKRSFPSILPVDSPRGYTSTRMCQSAFPSATQLLKLPAFAVSFAAAPTFFLSMHLKLLMAQTFASASLQDKSLCPLEDPLVANELTSVDFPGDAFFSENVGPIIPNKALGTALVETISERVPFAEPHPKVGLVAGAIDGIEVAQDIVCAKSDTKMSVRSGSNDFEEDIFDTTLKPGRLYLQEFEQFVASSAPVSKPILSPGSLSKERCSGFAGLNIQLPGLCESDKASVRRGNIPIEASAYKGNTDLSRRRGGRSTSIQGNFGNGPKKPRTQVQYALPPGGLDFSSNHSVHNQRVVPYKRIRRSNEKILSEAFRGLHEKPEFPACCANVLVTLREKGWRECGARVVLELTDHNEWILAVKISGATKYSHKVNHILQTGSTNRYTHAMMWKGGKDWMLEFLDRSQWIIFKEIYEECHSRNIRAASVKNIPIPGVRLIEESDDCADEPLFIRNSPRYFRQVESDVEMALNPSRVFYDMDSDDEQWISVTRKSLYTNEMNMKEISDELFEKTMDMLEKIAYTQQRDEFTVNELEDLVQGFDSIELLKAIYQHWLQKRRRKGMPLIRHLQPLMWERYQEQVKSWEESVARESGTSGGCREKIVSMEKPNVFAFCLKPRGLEVLNKGSKQRSQKRIPVFGHHQVVSADQDGLHTYGRRNGFSEEKIVFSGKNSEFPDTSSTFHYSSLSFSAQDCGGNSFLPLSGDVYEWSHCPKFNQNRLRNGALTSPTNSELLASYNQRTSGAGMNGVHRWNMDSPELPNQKTWWHQGSQRLLDGLDFHEYRLMDASGEAQHARNVAKLKRERAQKLLFRADLAIQKAAVALMTAEAVKASFDSSCG